VAGSPDLHNFYSIVSLAPDPRSALARIAVGGPVRSNIGPYWFLFRFSATRSAWDDETVSGPTSWRSAPRCQKWRLLLPLLRGNGDVRWANVKRARTHVLTC